MLKKIKEKNKKFANSHPGVVKILKGLGFTALLVLVYETGFSRGKDYGVDNLIEDIIHKYENGESLKEHTYCSSDPELGDLMYEIKCECIGD